jgi:hypothetical protein
LAIDAHLKSSPEKHHEMREISMKQQESIVVTILKSSNPGLTKDMTEIQHLKCQEYYSAQLSVRDREKIIQVVCRQTPDFTTSILRDSIAAYDPMIRTVHNQVDLRKYVSHVQMFIDDLIQTSKPKPACKGKQTVPPSIEDYVILLRRNKTWLFKYLHDFAKGCPEIRDQFHHWVKGVMRGFQQETTPSEDASGQKTPTGISHSVVSNDSLSNSASSMDGSLQSIFSELPWDTQNSVMHTLNSHDKYIISLEHLSKTRLQHIMDGLKKDSSTSSYGSVSGPGVYRSRWQSLLDNTIITSEHPSGPPRYGRDVKHFKTRGKAGTVTASNDKAFDTVTIAREESHGLPEPPDVANVYVALGPSFKKLVAAISRPQKT